MDPRRPVIPLGVEEDPDYDQLTFDGDVRPAPRIILDPEDIGRMKAGYVCAKCWEAHATPFPQECSVCRFPMSARQSEFLAKAFKGNVRMGPSSSLEDELAAMEDLEKREKRGSTVSAPQILVPGMWRAS